MVTDHSLHSSVTPVVPPSREQYRHEIRRAAAGLLRAGVDPREVPFRCRGAFPSDVAELVGLGTRVAPPPSFKTVQGPSWRTGDADLIESEWYFDSETVQTLLSRFTLKSEAVIAIGCPTLAISAATAGARAVLIDSSPWLSPPELPTLDYRRVAVEDVELHSEGPAVLFLDPPWHLDDYLTWMTRALSLLAKGSRMYLVLPDELSLRAGKTIRQLAIEFFSPIGQVDVVKDVVRYVTPSFEREILRSAGQSDHNWRTADLLEVRVTNPTAISGRPSHQATPWHHYKVGRTVVRVLGTSPDDGRFTFDLPDGVDHLTGVLSSPSRSLLDRIKANVVSSRGIALRVLSGGATFLAVLENLQGGSTRERALYGFSESERDDLERVLDLILGSEAS